MTANPSQQHTLAGHTNQRIVQNQPKSVSAQR